MHRINYWAVVVSAIVMWLVEACWYTIFGNQGIAASGWSAAQVQAVKDKHDPLPYVIALICALIMAYVLVWCIEVSGRTTAWGGLKVGIATWVGFVATTWLTEYSFEMKTTEIYFINTGYALIGLAIMGLILGGWRRRA